MFKTALGATLVAAALAPVASQAAALYAPVISSTPVTQQVAMPQQVCGVEQQVVRAQPSGAGALIGAIAGGLFGNAVGSSGGGRAIATGVGAVAGAALGNTVEANAAANYPAGSVPVQRCQTVNAYQTRTVGYDVVYEYNGQRYTTRLPNDPGARVRVDLRASAPVEPPAMDYDSATPEGYPSDAPPPQRYGTPVPPAPGYQPAPVYQPGYQQAPVYQPAPAYQPAPVVYSPAPVYAPAPVYVRPPAVYIAPTLGFYGTWGHRHWH